MKRNLLIAVMACMTGILVAQEQVEVITGPAYVNDAYYSLENGTVDTVPQANWDIAFSTGLYSASILANTHSGVELYTYDLGAIADWEALDTAGMTWDAMYNSMVSWEEGAFLSHAGVHPDYGWGVYGNMGLLNGDSIFIIKTLGGMMKKLAIVSKYYPVDYSENIYVIKYANLDGSEEVSDTIHTGPYASSEFVYYSIDSMEIVDRGLASEEWDLLFTKYTDTETYGVPYVVTGVLTNESHVLVQEVADPELDQATLVDFEEQAFTDTISVIGSDWKTFNLDLFAYELDSTKVFFLKKYSGADSAYYKIYFTGFTGSSEGKYTFMQEMLSVVSARAPERMNLLQVYPNPASDYLNLVYDHTGDVRIEVIDITGRTLYSRVIRSGGFSQFALDITTLEPGLHFLRMDDGQHPEVVRFIKE